MYPETVAQQDASSSTEINSESTTSGKCGTKPSGPIVVDAILRFVLVQVHVPVSLASSLRRMLHSVCHQRPVVCHNSGLLQRFGKGSLLI